jgi:energy-coupling factor transporter ATP-binding protein EcfA2
MTNVSSSTLEQISGALSQLHLEKAESIQHLFPSKNAGGIAPKRWYCIRSIDEKVQTEVGGQFDLKVDGLVLDQELGTIGLIHIVPGKAEWKEPWSGWFRKRIDEAAYLRHLLLENARDEQEPRQALAVELVFVTLDNSGSIAEGGQVLRDLMRETTVLHAIGVNLWQSPLDQTANLRRAFSWLLHWTRIWLDKNKHTEPGRRLRSMRLDDFRVAATRKILFSPKHAMHLVHGHNGSGKSSLVEALELAMTGKLERLETHNGSSNGQAKNYHHVLTNRNVRDKKAAAVTLTFSSHRRFAARVTQRGINIKPLHQNLKAGSFRMDQGLADRLATQTPAVRAKTFLEAFFPEKTAELDKWRAASALFEGALHRLSERHRKLSLGKSAPTPKLVAEKLAWTGAQKVPWRKVLELLGTNEKTSSILKPLFTPKLAGHFQDKGQLKWSAALDLATDFDKGLRRFVDRVPHLTEVIGRAISLLDGLGAVSVQKQAETNRDLPALMNEWLELVALVDLLQKEDEIFSTLELAQHGGYDFSHNPVLASWRLPRGKSPKERKQKLVELREKCEAARRLVNGYATGAEQARRAIASLPPLASFDLAALDEAARAGVWGEEFKKCQPGLSEAVRNAFQRNQEVDVRAGERILVRVGAPNWGADLLSRLRQVLSALKDFHPLEEIALNVLLQELRATREAAIAFQGSSADVVKEFDALLGTDEQEGTLGAAVNELTALFTPARWAYQDLITKSDLRNSEQKLDFITPDGISAHLRLNTAELNAFALALFLLCARRVANSLRLIVLDDPLQNMDELTVVTVARGLSRVLRLWNVQEGSGDPLWQVLILLHGEENVERIRHEVPCVVHWLPWLTPQEATNHPPITTSCSMATTFQDVTDVFRNVGSPVPSKKRS